MDRWVGMFLGGKSLRQLIHEKAAIATCQRVLVYFMDMTDYMA